MYELIRVSEHDYYIDCPAKMGLVLISDTEAVLIDSGSDKDAGKKALRHIEANGWKLTAILNTHSHADHIGGNRLLQDRTGCRIFVPSLDCVYTNHPELEAMTLYGGQPMKELQNKFLRAQESHAEPLPADGLPGGIQPIPLPGHSFDMTGYLTPDGTLYAGDCVSSRETLEKYGIGYLWDVGASLESLAFVKTVSAKAIVPAHAAVAESITQLADFNAQAMRATADVILSLCDAPATFEEILQGLFAHYGLVMSVQQYALIGSTLRSYLTWLYGQGKVSFCFADNRMLWQAKAAENE